MKSNELRPCDLCGKGLMHTGLPLFWRVRLERMGVDIQAVRERQGLALIMGNAALAEVFAPTSHVANPILDKPDELLVCESCAMNPHAIGELAEISSDREQRASGT